MAKAGEVDKKEFVVRIGPLLREALDRQKKKIKDVTYDSVKASDFECGEILAKKLGVK